MDMERAAKNLRARGYSVKLFKTGTEAADYLEAEIRDTQAGIGGSVTVRELGLYERLRKNNQVYWHWQEPGNDTVAAANAAPVYISSANAISETGEILNIDGRGNRLSAQVYGDKRLYIVAGSNKLCPDFHSALARARNIAAVKNCQRLNKNTPCRADGKCHDCASPERICNALLVLWGPMQGMETEVILIDEALGY